MFSFRVVVALLCAGLVGRANRLGLDLRVEGAHQRVHAGVTIERVRRPRGACRLLVSEHLRRRCVLRIRDLDRQCDAMTQRIAERARVARRIRTTTA